RALAETERLTTLAPSFMREIAEIRTASQDDLVLELFHSSARVLIPIGVDIDRIEELRRVLADLDVRFPRSDDHSGGHPKHHVDLRFDDQVVVRPSNSGERS